jgi:hypothetical protein
VGVATTVSIPYISVIIIGLMITVVVVVVVGVCICSLIVDGITVVVSEDRSRGSIHIIIQVFLQR